MPPKVFGFMAFVHISSCSLSKLKPRANKFLFLGYFPNRKGYICYYPYIRKKFISLIVTFFESQSYYSRSDLQRENERTCENQSLFLFSLPTWKDNISIDDKWTTNQSQREGPYVGDIISENLDSYIEDFDNAAPLENIVESVQTIAMDPNLNQAFEPNLNQAFEIPENRPFQVYS